MKQSYRFVFLMDPYHTLNLQTETSLLLIDELLQRGHEVYWLEAGNLYLSHSTPRGLMQGVASVSPFQLLEAQDLLLNDFDAMLVRLDPPFDSRYLHISYMLDFLTDDVLQFNDVGAIRNFNEKILPLRWPAITPASLITQSPQQLRRFLLEHQDIVIKPLDDCSGRGIVRLNSKDSDEQDLAKTLKDSHGKTRYVMAQQFLPSVAAGDKRVYLVDGKPVGWVNRKPREGSFLANIHQGALCEATDLSEQEMSAIKTIAPFLRKQGLFLVGVDFIGGLMTEINLTSPSAVRQINEVMGAAVHLKIVDAMLRKIDAVRRQTMKKACCGIERAA